MRLMMFEASGGPRLGVVEGDKVIDVAAADLALPKTMLALIEAGPDALARVAAAVKGAGAEATLALKDVTPALPIERPGKFVCVGLNYAAHAREGGHEPPKYPSLFVRWPSSLVAAEAPVILPKVCEQLDYEAELTFVIGKGGRAIPEDKGLDHVFGYTLFNDVSVRAWQRYTPQWTQGKNFDGITSRVNGETRQDSNTGDMIFGVAKLVEILSEFMTLEPGDVVATGTPSGVAHAMKPPGWMKAGDRVEVEVEGIGILGNPIVAEV